MESKKTNIKYGFAIAGIAIASALAYFVFSNRKRKKISSRQKIISENPYLDRLILSMRNLGYKVYGDGRWNIVGVRSNTGMTDTFDDWIHLFRKDGNKMEYYKYPITTDPGLYYLNHPMNVKGTGIMAPGQYVDAYAFGLHNGQYEALKQVGPVNAYRDSNRDSSYDFLENSIQSGIFGMNIHHSGKTEDKNKNKKVTKWSAGCQVFANISDFLQFIGLLKKSGQTRFTYTLMRADQIK